MQTFFTLEQFDEIAGEIRKKTQDLPKIAIILGSGLGGFADSISEPVSIPYADLPHWPVSTVPGHAGRLIIGKLEDKSVLVMQGRIHFYEGYSMQQVTLPIRVMQRLGIEVLIVTNAAGAVNPGFEPGDLMLITDHINYVGMAGFNPLFGPNIDELGPRFPDMSQAYDRQLIQLARSASEESKVPLQEGIYIGLSGPSFEGPADLRFLRLIGADAVGMSTVSEVTVARHGNTRVLGISGISNKANLDGNSITTHEEVLEAGKTIAPKMEKLIRTIIRKL